MSQDPSCEAKQLLDEGWTRKNAASEPRLSEAVEMYTELGFEVRLVPALQDSASGEGDCTQCFAGDDPSKYQVIYVRRRSAG